jgi:hypothetical protein
VHCRTNGWIEHPSGENDRYACFRFDDNNIPARSPLSIELPDPAAVQRMPAIMDLYILVDMGRMAPQWRYQGRIVCSRAVTLVRHTAHLAMSL